MEILEVSIIFITMYIYLYIHIKKKYASIYKYTSSCIARIGQDSAVPTFVNVDRDPLQFFSFYLSLSEKDVLFHWGMFTYIKGCYIRMFVMNQTSYMSKEYSPSKWDFQYWQKIKFRYSCLDLINLIDVNLDFSLLYNFQIVLRLSWNRI